jgi:adenylate kinase
MVRLVLLGPPGAGKGTQAVRIAQEFRVPHVSTGDILRQAVAEKTPLGLEAKKIMEAGQLVSDDIVAGIIRERLAQPDCAKGVILDGYPRTLQQAEILDGLLSEKSSPPVLVTNIDVDYEELVKRIAGRRSCPKCGAVFNVHFKPPRREGFCDECATGLIQRPDDQEETVRKRLEVYDSQTKPLLEYYADRLSSVDGMGTPEEIFEKLAQRIRAAAEGA